MIRVSGLLLFLLAITATSCFSQKLTVLKSNTGRLDIRDGDDLRKGRWNIDLKTKPDIFESSIVKKYKWVTFISDIDAVRFKVKANRKYSFVVVLNSKDTAYTQINGIKAVPNAKFNKRYIKFHNNKSFVEIPPVYELFNVISALTSFGKKDNGLIIKNTLYYKDLLAWFDKYKDETVVIKMDSILSGNLMNFISFKMDSYAFELSADGKLRESKIYDRISVGHVNTLKPYINDLQAFCYKSKFAEFYKNHHSYYTIQTDFLKDSLGLQQMQKWLTLNFPTTRYNSFKVIFSPLVGNIQSAAWFENKGFKEAQAHVNFPYRDSAEVKVFSSEALNVRDGNIMFTELNHSFINPEAEKPQYRQAITDAFSDLAIWNEKGKPAAQYYNNSYACFNEYVNWGLTSLRYLDYAPADEQNKLIAAIKKRQIDIRGFRKFGIFNQYLIGIYKRRAKGQTVADLYPLIVKWFENNK